MCSNRPIYGFVVTEERYEKALQAIKRFQKILSNEIAVQVLTEIGYGDALKPTPDGVGFKLDLSNLQYVVFAAGLAAVAETGGKQELTPEWKDASDD